MYVCFIFFFSTIAKPDQVKIFVHLENPIRQNFITIFGNVDQAKILSPNWKTRSGKIFQLYLEMSIRQNFT